MISARKSPSAPTQCVELGSAKGLCAVAEIYCYSDNVSLRRRNYILLVRQSVSARTQGYEKQANGEFRLKKLPATAG